MTNPMDFLWRMRNGIWDTRFHLERIFSYYIRNPGFRLPEAEFINYIPGGNVFDFTRIYENMLSIVNYERHSRLLFPVFYDYDLCIIAKRHADDMIRRRFFSHVNPDGLGPFDRISDYGFGFQIAGENIAIGQLSVEEVHTVWMRSPGHRANILLPESNVMGLGISQTSRDMPYYPGFSWVQVFTD